MVMSLDQIFNSAGSGMSAQSIRLNTIASNLANAGSVGSTESSTYHTKYPVFKEVKNKVMGISTSEQPIGGVQVTKVMQSQNPLEKTYNPTHPLANSDGYVYQTDVNPIQQMTDMVSASKDYQANVDVMNTTKSLIMATLNVLK